jgi:hypothetical protein
LRLFFKTLKIVRTIGQSESQNSIAHFIFPIASVPLKSEHQEVTFWMKANRETETKSDSKPYLFLEIFPCEFAVAIPITRKNQWELKTLDLSFLKLPLTSNAILSLIILPTPEDIFLEFGSFKIGHYDMEDDLQDAFQKTGEQIKAELKDLRIDILQDYWLREKSPEFSLDTYKIVFHTALLQVQPSRQKWESERDSFIYKISLKNDPKEKCQLSQMGERPPDIPYDIYTNIYVVSPKERTQTPRQQNRIRESLLKIFSSPCLWLANRKIPVSITTGVTEKERFHETWGVPFLRLKISAWSYGEPRKYYLLNSLVSLKEKEVKDNAENENALSILFEKEKPQ